MPLYTKFLFFENTKHKRITYNDKKKRKRKFKQIKAHQNYKKTKINERSI